MEKITYRLKDYPHLPEVIEWYRGLNRRESVEDLVAQISMAGGGIPYLAVAYSLNKLTPVPELQNLIDDLQEFYYAEIEEDV